MKTLFFDCGMGAAGDMISAALFELLPDKDRTLAQLNALSLPGVTFEPVCCTKCGIVGTHMRVTVNGEQEGEHGHDHEHDHEHHHEHGHMHTHEHKSPADIDALVGRLALPETVKADILSIFHLIAEAESHVHGVPVSDIHFHEVGTMDAIADVTAACLFLHEIAPDDVIASPIHVGSGHVSCAHGILPVPAPATAFVLRDVPIYGGGIKGELCTPTGAAVLRHFVTRFGTMPVMRVSAIGYGMGTKDFETANCIRALLGETEGKTDEIVELSCNVDDMTGEAVGFALERLFEIGAREVYTVPIGMKKSRPGTLIRVLCTADDREKMVRALFCHTSTIGIRESVVKRYTLDRKTETVTTEAGPVRKKISCGYGVRREKIEYDDLAKIAKENNLSLSEAQKIAQEP